ncbi:hypothetical protein R80B4_01621 [Fibrobacteres bacterium R8-0-B4]
MCIEGGRKSILLSAGVGIIFGCTVGAVVGALSNELGVMTANEICLRIYVLKKNSLNLCSENIEDVIVLYYDTFTKLEIKKFFIWNSIKIQFMFEHENKPRKIKIVVSDKTIVQKEQKENVRKLIDFLKKLKQNHSL